MKNHLEFEMSLIGRTEGFSSFSCPAMLDFYIQSYLYIKSDLEIIKYDTESFRWRIGTSSDVCEFKMYSDFLLSMSLLWGDNTHMSMVVYPHPVPFLCMLVWITCSVSFPLF